MQNRFTQLCLWSDESVAASAELQELFRRERVALIHLRGEELSEITMAKEVLVRKVTQIRAELKKAALAWYGAENPDALAGLLPPEHKAQWAVKQGAWVKSWDETCKEASRSQLLLEHSQRNLGRLVDHWRRQIGEAPLYSNKGQKVDAPSTGRVFEAKY